MSFIGQYIALFNHSSHRFIQMREDGTVGVLEDSSVHPQNLEPWRSYERFFVVDAGFGKVALHCPVFNRFIRIDGESVDGFGGKRDANNLHVENERFTIVDAGNGKFAFHNALHNRFIRICFGRVDTLGGPKDVDKLPEESEWGAERCQIVLHPMPYSHISTFIGQYIALFNHPSHRFIQMRESVDGFGGKRDANNLHVTLTLTLSI